MSILNLLEGIPINANLRSKILDLEKENSVLRHDKTLLTDENALLKGQLKQANMEIERLNKVPKPPNKISWQRPPASRSDNMI